MFFYLKLPNCAGITPLRVRVSSMSIRNANFFKLRNLPTSIFFNLSFWIDNENVLSVNVFIPQRSTNKIGIAKNSI